MSNNGKTTLAAELKLASITTVVSVLSFTLEDVSLRRALAMPERLLKIDVSTLTAPDL